MGYAHAAIPLAAIPERLALCVKADRQTKLKDAVCTLAGLAGLATQQVTGKVDLALLLAYMFLIGLPGFSHVIGLLRGWPTDSGSSPSVSSASSGGSSSSGQKSPGDEDESS